MPIRVHCPHCFYSLGIPDDLVGRKARCPKCTQVFSIPLPVSGEPTESRDLIEPYRRQRIDLTSRKALANMAIGFFAVLLIGIVPLAIVSCGRDKPVPHAEPAAPTSRLLSSDDCIVAAQTQAWGTGIREIPATVIDKGILRHVPYRSFQANDYELNIYGDPTEPACVEIGIRNESKSAAIAKTNCIRFIRSILREQADKDHVGQLTIEKSIRKSGALTFEVTPDTDEDADGGWWISIYDENALAQARASEAEMQDIAVVTKGISDVPQPPGSPSNSSGWTLQDLALPFRSQPPTAIPQTRPSAPMPTVSGQGQGNAPRTVEVRGYTRSDGTYVPPHTVSSSSSASRSSGGSVYVKGYTKKTGRTYHLIQDRRRAAVDFEQVCQSSSNSNGIPPNQFHVAHDQLQTWQATHENRVKCAIGRAG